MGGIEAYDPIVQIIKIGIAIFSAILIGISLGAYRKNRAKRILYAAIAFGLFAGQLTFDFLGDVPSFDQPYNDLILYAMTLAILLLFFVAISRK